MERSTRIRVFSTRQARGRSHVRRMWDWLLYIASTSQRRGTKREVAYWLELATSMRDGAEEACGCVQKSNGRWQAIIRLRRRGQRTFIVQTSSTSKRLVEQLSTKVVRQTTASSLTPPTCVPTECDDCNHCEHSSYRERRDSGIVRVVRHKDPDHRRVA